MGLSARVKFFICHLTVSIFIALLIIILIFYIWYPDPLSKALGVQHLFLILIMIDVIVGPILSLTVYNEKKKSLKMDLAIIIIIQISAFLYGFYTIFLGKPAWIAFNRTGFEVVTVIDLLEVKDSKENINTIPWGMPKWVAISGFNDVNQQNKDQDSELMGNPVVYQSSRYVNIGLAVNSIRNNSRTLDKLNAFNDEAKIQEILKNYPEVSGWLPLIAHQLDMVVLVNKEKGEVVKIVDLRPWK